MDRSDGGVDVIDAVSGRPIDVVQPGTNGFPAWHFGGPRTAA